MVNLAKKIHSSARNGGWGGTVVHFGLDSLLCLFEKYLLENEARVQDKEMNFRKFTHRYLIQPNLHRNEPDEYKEANYSVIDFGEQDIEEMFEKLDRIDVETESLDIEAYLIGLRMLTD